MGGGEGKGGILNLDLNLEVGRRGERGEEKVKEKEMERRAVVVAVARGWDMVDGRRW